MPSDIATPVPAIQNTQTLAGISFDTVQNLEDHGALKRIRRAGIVVYTWKRNKCYFGLGIDKGSGDVSDFGGCRKKTDPDCLTTALREFEEESLGIYGHYETKDLKDCFGLCNYETLIIFLRIDIDPKIAIRLYNQALDKENSPEMSKIIWTDTANFIKLVTLSHNRYKMYTRIRDILVQKIKELCELFQTTAMMAVKTVKAATASVSVLTTAVTTAVTTATTITTTQV